MSQIFFHGGAGTVTGANFLLETANAKILVDCGLVQGSRFAMEVNAEPFPYDPKAIDALLVTHAHADHIGRIPKLVRDGFEGVIYSTEPTRELASVMLRDARKVMQYEANRYGTLVFFDEKDIGKALTLWKALPYDEHFAVTKDVSAVLTDAGHILGSAMVTLERNKRRFLFTGDVGNAPQPLLNPPKVVTGYDYAVMESVYGDRVHEEVTTRAELLRTHIEAVIKKQGTLIIPAFSLERTQAMLYEINNFVEQGGMEAIPVFLDSPLAIAVTDIYKQHIDYLKDSVRKQAEAGDDIFQFPKLSLTKSVKDSSDIGKIAGAKIIIAGSGMSHGGRILGHERVYLEDPKNTLLLVGYQAVGSLGRLLQDGAKKVRILGHEVNVRATIATIRGYSGHADRDQLIDFIGKGAQEAKRIFVTMGEERASLFLVQRLRDYLGLDAVAPDLGESYEIDF